MDSEKTLMWVNKRFMWHDLDTSFGNRVVNWEAAYYLKEALGRGHRILMEKKEWPEVDNNFIFLPDTSLIQNIDQKVIDTPNIKEVQESFCHHMDSAKQLSDCNHLTYTFDFGKFNESNELLTSTFLNTLQTKYENEIRPLSYIKIKNYLVENYLKEVTEDVIGIHLRRGSGVAYEKDKVEIESSNVKESYLDFRSRIYIYNHEGYPYINDNVYFNIIDNFLKINPKQKFYISTDLPFHLISYYIEKYGDNIILKETIIDKIKELLILSGDIIDTDEKKLTIYNMVDLFALSFCKFLIKSNTSTWSLFAEEYRKQPSVISEEKWESIIEQYNNSKNNTKTNTGIKKLI
jgi:hypothetical protein